MCRCPTDSPQTELVVDWYSCLEKCFSGYSNKCWVSVQPAAGRQQLWWSAGQQLIRSLSTLQSPNRCHHTPPLISIINWSRVSWDEIGFQERLFRFLKFIHLYFITSSYIWHVFSLLSLRKCSGCPELVVWRRWQHCITRKYSRKYLIKNLI